MKRVRVCIYGGTDLRGMPVEFISALAYKILDTMPAVIITGGFLHSNEAPQAVSTDAAALQGARRYVAEHAGIDMKNCYEAWIPEPALDRSDLKGVVRMSQEDGITVRVMTGRTALGRRLAMAAGVTLSLPFSGRRHRGAVVERPLEL